MSNEPQDAAPERSMDDLAAELAADLQEAQSIKYVDALRLMKLSSGRWAVSKLWSGSRPEIMPELSVGRLEQMLREQGAEQERFKTEVAARLPKPRGGSLDISIEELFE